MQATQATFEQWSIEPTDPLPFDDYGPTGREPLPVAEEKRQAWKERLRAQGFSPNCLLESLGLVALEKEYHPDDADRNRWPESDRTAFELAEERRA